MLRGRRERFTVGAVVSGFATLLVLNFMNPDALVARVNIERARVGYELDVPRLELRHSGERVPLEPLAFDVLRYLVEHRDRVVTR